MIQKDIYDKYLNLLKAELIPALGCTEPIAIAYASAKATEVLSSFPTKISVECSGNVLKNAKGVIVPATGGLKGVEASAIIGAVGGDPKNLLAVLSKVKDEDIKKTRDLVKTDYCTVKIKRGVENLYIKVFVQNGNENASVLLIDKHTNITEITKNGKVIQKRNGKSDENTVFEKKDFTVDSIYEFANQVKIKDIKEIIEIQIEMNMNIAKEGLLHSYGANVGKVLMSRSKDIKTIAKAYSAAGTDAKNGRMHTACDNQFRQWKSRNDRIHTCDQICRKSKCFKRKTLKSIGFEQYASFVSKIGYRKIICFLRSSQCCMWCRSRYIISI